MFEIVMTAVTAACALVVPAMLAALRAPRPQPTALPTGSPVRGRVPAPRRVAVAEVDLDGPDLELLVPAPRRSPENL